LWIFEAGRPISDATGILMDILTMPTPFETLIVPIESPYQVFQRKKLDEVFNRGIFVHLEVEK